MHRTRRFPDGIPTVPSRDGMLTCLAIGGLLLLALPAFAQGQTYCYEDAECDDQNVCTDEYCGDDYYCHYVVNTGPCDDGSFCNGPDSCSDGVCIVHAGDPCPGPDGDGDCSESCDEELRACTAGDPMGAACDDGLFCNGTDSCSDGVCILHGGDPCPGSDEDGDCSESCDEAANACNGPDPEGSWCTDGLFCTGEDSCSEGECSVHSGNSCPGPDGDGDCSESCNEVANDCTGADPEGAVCDDGVTCTAADACASGSCAGTAQDSLCSDGLFCTGEERCDPAEGCLAGPRPTQPGKVCREDPIVHAPTALEPGWPEGIGTADVGGERLAYVAAGTEGLRIYSVSDPASPTLLASYIPEASDCRRDWVDFDEVAVYGTTAYVAGGRCGLLIVDVDLDDPANPSLLGAFPTQDWVKSVQVRTESSGGKTAYLTDYWGGLRIVDVSRPSALSELGSLDESGGLIGPALTLQVQSVTGRLLAYVATMAGLFIVDVTVPALPAVVGSHDTTGGLLVTDPSLEDIPQHVLVMGSRAYVPIWQGGLLVLDVSDPGNPVVIQEIETVPGQAFFKVAAGGMNVYVTEGQCGLRVFGTSQTGLAEAFFETLDNPIKLGGGEAACTEPSGDPWAWNLEQLGGVAHVTNGVLGPPHQGSLQSIDFRQPGSGLSGSGGCGIGSELALLIPLLAWSRKLTRRRR